MRIGIDLDGCVVDFISDARRACENYWGTIDQFAPEPDCWDFPVKQWGLTYDAFWQAVRHGVAHKVVWFNTPPVEGALDALKALKKNGHSVHICTSRPGFEVATTEWLNRFRVPYDSVTISEDKTIVDVDVFVEDSPTNLMKLWESGVEAIRFDQPWNRNMDFHGWKRKPYFVESWSEVKECVDELAKF